MNSLLKKKSEKFKFLSILSAFIVPLIVTGPFLPDLLLSSLVLWFIVYSIKNKNLYEFQNIYFYFFIAFWLICVISSLLSTDIQFSLKASLFYVRIGIFAIFISFLINKHREVLDYFYYSLIITFSIIVIDGYFQYFTGFNLIGLAIKDFRISSFFGDELVMGSYLSRLFPLLFALFVIRKKNHILEILSISLLFILVDVLIFLSGERAAFVLLNLSTIFIILFITKYKLLRLLVFILSCLMIITITINDSKLYGRYVLTPIQSMGFNDADGKKYFFTPAHDSLIKTSWNMFLDKPILGHGPKMFRIHCKNPKYSEGVKPCNTHPHNFYAQLLAETGLIGFSFLVGVFIYFIYLTLKHIFEKWFQKKPGLTDYQICLLAGLLITIWPLTTNGSLFTNYLMLFYSLQMGFFKKNL